MILSILIAFGGGVVFVVSGLVVVLYLRKRFANRKLKLIGQSARVETSLTPEGTVILGGELWPARSTDDAIIPAESLVRIVGVRDLSLLVELAFNNSHQHLVGARQNFFFKLNHSSFPKKSFSWHASCSRYYRQARKTQCKG
ncbi:MAG TPA: NfeD family protein [Pyrinomonadaceae bacterium]|jgi:hypothetical protein|nr:NfeD family protein [Pyrinomonadaceae bacterium]